MKDINKLKDASMWLRFLLWCVEEKEDLEGREEIYLNIAIRLLKEYKDIKVWKGGLVMIKYNELIFWRYDLPNKRISFNCIKCKGKFMSSSFCKSRKKTYLCLSCEHKLIKAI